MRIVVLTTMRTVRDCISVALLKRGFPGGIEQACLGQADAGSLAPRDLLLISAPLPDGTDFVRRVRAIHPGITVGVLATTLCHQEFIAWAEIGIVGYIEADTSAEDIAGAILRIADGETVYPARLSSLLLQRFAHRHGPVRAHATVSSLTRREVEVVELIADGLSNKQIARRLSIRDATVKNHVHSILEKFAVPSRGAAAAHFRQFSTSGGGARAGRWPLPAEHPETSLTAYGRVPVPIRPTHPLSG